MYNNKVNKFLSKMMTQHMKGKTCIVSDYYRGQIEVVVDKVLPPKPDCVEFRVQVVVKSFKMGVKKRDENFEYVRDENGQIVYEVKEYKSGCPRSMTNRLNKQIRWQRRKLLGNSSNIFSVPDNFMCIDKITWGN